MSDATNLTEFLKSLPSEKNGTGKSVLIFDSNGNPFKKSYANFIYKDLYAAEAKDTVLTLKEFIEKYVQVGDVGEMAGVNRFEFATMFYLKLTSTVTINMQYYHALITKRFFNVNSQWGLFSFMLFPSGEGGDNIYEVTYYNGNAPQNPTITVRALQMELLPP